MSERSGEQVPADLLRRALKNHDAIAAALRAGGPPSRRLERAIDDMRALKVEAVALDCYPAPSSILRGPDNANRETPS